MSTTIISNIRYVFEKEEFKDVPAKKEKINNFILLLKKISKEVILNSYFRVNYDKK